MPKRLSLFPKIVQILTSSASVVAGATLATRLVGLMREQVNAAVFGIGPLYGAFQYAVLLPNLFLVVLGGINGPLHSAVLTILANYPPEKSRAIVRALTVVIGGAMLGVTGLLVWLAPQGIDLIAPGLAVGAGDVRGLAIRQLQIMAATVWFGSMIGLNIGLLTWHRNYWLPTLSPLLSSLAAIAGAFWFNHGVKQQFNSADLASGQVLAWAYLAGAVLQWGVLWLGLRGYPLSHSLSVAWRHLSTWSEIRVALRLIASSCLFMSVTRANWYIDLAFASWLPEPGAAASALTLAFLVVQAPAGIFSNVMLVPLVPNLAQVANEPGELWERSQRALSLMLRFVLPMGGLMALLATPIVALTYRRGAFDPEATLLVGHVLRCYGLGLGAYLSRELLVRVLHVLRAHRALGWLSAWSLGLNILFNGFLYQSLGVAGLALGSSVVDGVLSLGMWLWLRERLVLKP
ncbi:lipid II flippase MurJ [Leptothoe sp. ISB3NOV94-8A]